MDQCNLTSLKRIVSGAAPLGAALTKAVQERFRSRGAQVTIVQVREASRIKQSLVLTISDIRDSV